ncbi:hypothetical protein PHLGIDRAFT_310310 [Phlebiopsis gigantea 11061_1 CR5-6]|uniref:Uncharacterized protein n=1 Tax=Phlebiopsis gigantea (strain 11061_1 CR5-6) TaxID=745531 RepID=A0A0C3RQJ1_PHLG1|nr:hypothetical protein PHLGIDRAFT_310310 [Phlebiopsis gigantea 11061_1 CR5-6]
MLSLVPALALAIVSFISSAFVILRIVIPSLPPHPLSRRVPPSEFGLPDYRTLSPAEKSHIWLASCDLVALAIFVWQALSEYFGGSTGYGIVSDPGSAVRLWIATTLRQSCLLIVAALTLAHVRIGKPVAFGKTHWMLWAPTLLLTVTSTALAGILAEAGVESFFWGLVGYSAAVAIMTSVAFACLIGTLFIIRRNLATLNDARDPWPPTNPTERVRRSFTTEDINALKDGSSWITSRASSRCESVSAFSFSTHHTHHSRMPSNASTHSPIHPNVASQLSIPAKSSFWFSPATPVSPIPPVPPLPAPYRPSTASTYNVNDDPDPFRRVDPRVRMGSQTSWLSEASGWQHERTVSEWSFPSSHSPAPGSPRPYSPYPHNDLLGTELLPSTAVSRPQTSAPASPVRGVLGGYGYAPDAAQAENCGVTTSLLAGSEVDVSIYRALSWMILIWVPVGLAVPYFVTTQFSTTSPVLSLMLVLSVTLSSPLLAANILLRSPIPIPTGLFDSPTAPPSVVMRSPSPCSSAAENIVREYKRSGSATVVEGSRSGDVWLTNGNATESKGKVARALTLLQPTPKLSVLPLQEEKPQNGEFSPPLPIQDVDSVPSTPQSHGPAEFSMNREMGTRKKDSKASSCYSGTDDSVAFATQIMIAQRHYSTLAMTMVFPPSPERRTSQRTAAATGVEVEITPAHESKRHSHLRARSTSSTMNSTPRSAISAPPSTPLPPTPPTVKSFKAASASRRLAHRKSYSSSAEEFSFGPIENDNTKEIDALSAGLLPLLIPGIKVGHDMKITEGWNMSPTVVSMNTKQRKSRLPSEMGGVSSEFLSPQDHSTPNTYKTQAERTRKPSTHKRNHLSLPSLSFGKDGSHTSSARRSDASRAPNNKPGQYALVEAEDVKDKEDSRRATVCGGESQCLKIVTEEDEISQPASPGYTTGFPETLEVPGNVSISENSLITLISALDHELKLPQSANSEITLFDFDPLADGVAESTPQDYRSLAKSHSRSLEAAPHLPALSTKTSHRSSFVYFKSDENFAPPPAQSTSDLVGRSSPVVLPLSMKGKGSKVRAKKTNQENDVSMGLRQLSLLQDRSQNRAPAVLETKPLSLGKSAKKAAVQDVPNENVRREPSLKRALRPLRLGRSETTKQRAILRENEVLPDVVVRPPSDGQHVGLSYSFR